MSAYWAHMVWGHLSLCQVAPRPPASLPHWVLVAWRHTHHLACAWFTG